MSDEDKSQKELIDKYTELKEAMHDIEERYQALIETNLYGIQEIDIYGNITFMNSIQYQILGYEEGELRGRQIWDLLASDDERNELTDYLTRVALGEYAPFPWIGKYVRKGGETVELKVDWNCRRDVQDTVAGFVSIIADIMNREIRIDSFQAEKKEEPPAEAEPEDAPEPVYETELPDYDANFPMPYFETQEISVQLEKIQHQLEHLQEEFQSKLKYDAHKDKMIDKLHKELQEYKGDILKKYLKSMIMDLIQTIDTFRKLVAHYDIPNAAENDPVKLLEILKAIPSDLDDLFYRQGINTFICDEDTFDATRQKVLKTVETSDPLKDKTIAESLRPGYEWEDQVIRPEMVAVYIYSDPDQLPEDTDTDH